MILQDDYSDAQNIRIGNLFRNDNLRTVYLRAGMKGTHYNTSLISGLEKIDGFNETPFATYMIRYSKDILESDAIIFIGISLNDYHLNLFYNRETLPNKSIFYIDKKDMDSPMNLSSKTFFSLTGGELNGVNFDRMKEDFAIKGYCIVDDKEGYVFYTKGAEHFYKKAKDVFQDFYAE